MNLKFNLCRVNSSSNQYWSTLQLLFNLCRVNTVEQHLHTLPHQLEMLRVMLALENLGDACVPETILEHRVLRVQLQHHGVHLRGAHIAAWHVPALDLRRSQAAAPKSDFETRLSSGDSAGQS